MIRWAETEARFWEIIWESEWREDLEAFSFSCFRSFVLGEQEMRTPHLPWWERFYGVDLLLQSS